MSTGPASHGISADTVAAWTAAGQSLTPAALGAIDAAMLRLGDYSDWTMRHSERVGDYTRGFAARLGLPAPAVEALAQAARLHDIGKMATPHEVLDKPGALTDAERQVMNDHTSEGAAMLAVLPGLPAPFRSLAVDVAEGHHERFAGGGYPLNRSGSDIPHAARLVALADVFDALSAKRVYKPSRSATETLDMMSRFDGHFDPQLQQGFMAYARSLSLAESPAMVEAAQGGAAVVRKNHIKPQV